jgi:hypothetical protein
MNVTVKRQRLDKSIVSSWVNGMLRICINKCSSVWHVGNNHGACPDNHRLSAPGPMVKAWLMLLCLVWGSVAPGLAQIYRWTDDAGRVHFTDNPGTIPPERRAHSRQLAPDTTRSGDAADVPAQSLAPGVPPATTNSPQPAASERALLLQKQAQTLEDQIAAALQERQQLFEQINATRSIRLNPFSGALERRQIDEQGRALAAVEKRLDDLNAELQQVQAKLQELEQGTGSVPLERGPQQEPMLDNQGHDRTYWQQQLDALRTQLQQAQEKRRALLENLGADSRERRGFGRRGYEVLQQTRMLEQTEQEIRGTEAALEALRQDATRAGAPAEWLQ